MGEKLGINARRKERPYVLQRLYDGIYGSNNRFDLLEELGEIKGEIGAWEALSWIKAW